MNTLDPWPDLIVTAAALAFILLVCKEFLARNEHDSKNTNRNDNKLHANSIWPFKNKLLTDEIKANKIITPRRGKAVVLIFFNPRRWVKSH